MTSRNLINTTLALATILARERAIKARNDAGNFKRNHRVATAAECEEIVVDPFYSFRPIRDPAWHVPLWHLENIFNPMFFYKHPTGVIRKKREEQ
ncbi:uncharacterized protein AB675_4702 [Cyphellophora attinorum]|uniref:Uncharacterized protein n=1 Tax=Cyphellophora attinorum TaxID=1664694 RepID=A0A0N1NXT0_9EURO|nr:uncharacterized protein AB675_4702 [Phialophora attinorum]KPI38996.1 hypothetical protein AB675_4702 [Phialophora attinorum]